MSYWHQYKPTEKAMEPNNKFQVNRSDLNTLRETRDLRQQVANYKNAGGKPVSVGNWMLTIFLMAIPLINIVLLFVWAFGGNTEPNKSNWAIACLLWGLIVFVLSFLFFLIFGSFLALA